MLEESAGQDSSHALFHTQLMHLISVRDEVTSFNISDIAMCQMAAAIVRDETSE